jgi:uncharacterized protein (TIGR02145 family)
MAKSVVIQAYIPTGSIVGPFNLLSDADDYDTPFDTDVTVTELLSGYTATNVPDDATIVRIISTGICGNYVNSLIAPANVCVGEVTLGAQLWTPCNLNVDTYSDKTDILYAGSDAQWEQAAADGIGAWCYANDDASNEALYGKLYNQYAVQGIHNEASKTDISQRKSLAPAGYHIPTIAEWQTLKNWVDAQYAPVNTTNTGDKMKATTGWLNGSNGTNVTGFTARPGGSRYSFATFRLVGSETKFWSSTVGANNAAVIDTGDSLTYDDMNGGDGCSVRLIKNV